MKNLLNNIYSFGLQRILIIGGITTMLILLGLGPSMLKNDQKITIATASDKKPLLDPSMKATDTVGVVNGGSAGFDPSTFNIKPIKLPDGSITFPDYTLPPTPTAPAAATTIDGPDPTKCADAKAAMDAIDASHADEDTQLQASVTNYQNVLINNSKNYAARGYGPTADEQAADQRVQIAMQTANNTLMNNVREMNTKKAPYQLIVTQNCWNQ